MSEEQGEVQRVWSVVCGVMDWNSDCRSRSVECRKRGRTSNTHCESVKTECGRKSNTHGEQKNRVQSVDK